jgi:hypothetical protein
LIQQEGLMPTVRVDGRFLKACLLAVSAVPGVKSGGRRKTDNKRYKPQ